MAANGGGLGREEDVSSFVSNLLPEAAPGLDATGISGGPSELIMIPQRPDYCTSLTHLSFRYLWVIYLNSFNFRLDLWLLNIQSSTDCEDRVRFIVLTQG